MVSSTSIHPPAQLRYALRDDRESPDKRRGRPIFGQLLFNFDTLFIFMSKNPIHDPMAGSR